MIPTPHPIKPNHINPMKMQLILLASAVLPLWLNSCQTGEYHTVTVYERTHHVTKAAPKDDPRAFIPKERF